MHMCTHRVVLTTLTAQRTRGIPWDQRESRALFRGRDSNQARLDLVKLHRKNTELFDVGITAWFFFKHEEEVYGPKAERISFHDFFKVDRVANIFQLIKPPNFPCGKGRAILSPPAI